MTKVFAFALLAALLLPAVANADSQTVTANPQAAQKPEPAGGQAEVAEKPKWLKEDCVSRIENTDASTIANRNELKRPPGPELVKTTYFLPEDAPAIFVLRKPYDEIANVPYFGRLDITPDNKDGGKMENITGNISYAKIPSNHYLVQDHIANAGETLLTVQMPPNINRFWRKSSVYLYACKEKDGLSVVSSISLPVSSALWSRVLAAMLAVLVYLSAVAASHASAGTTDWKRHLDPVFMTAGADGKASLAKLQILFFSLIVFGLLGYIVARSGLVSDLSSTVLQLLGIAAIGATLGKVADAQNNKIDPQNWQWLAGKGWLDNTTEPPPNCATWRQLVTTDGEFDVYRYQSCIFSLIVGGALLVAGANELASFSIPDNILNVLLLSQGVYVFGKLVTVTPVAKLNKSATAVRELENAFQEAAKKRSTPGVQQAADQPPPPPTDLNEAILRAQPEYHKYKQAVYLLRKIFESATGKAVEEGKLQPSL